MFNDYEYTKWCLMDTGLTEDEAEMMMEDFGY